VPDLTVTLTATPVCPSEIKLIAQIANEGSAGAPPGVEISFFRTDAGANNPPQLLGTMSTTSTILPGGSETLVYSYASPPAGVQLDFMVSTDPSMLVDECDEDDNQATDDAQCQGVN
jgi:hypothetical protein